MARKLTHKEFYELISNKLNISEDRAKVIWEAIIDVIVDECLMYGTVTIPYLGYLHSHLRGGKVMTVPVGPGEDKGKTKEVYVEPYEIYYFSVGEAFREMVRGENSTPLQRRRQREVFRKIKKEEKIRQEQFEYMEKARLAVEAMNQKRMKRLERQSKNSKRASKKRKKNKEQEQEKKRQQKKQKNKDQVLQEETYWDELDEI